MKWQKLGQIFELQSSPFAKPGITHSASPQALVLEDRVRVYFSTRTPDLKKTFLSHIRYVDYDLDFENILGYSEQEVLKLGKVGCFDEHGIFPLSPVRVGDKVYAYTNGISRRVSVAVETAIGFALSTDDGKTFQKAGDGPLLAASQHEPFLVGDPFVREFEGQFHMFYIFGKKWSQDTTKHAAERVYKIAHAVSRDGLTDWQRESKFIVANKLGEDECQAMPTVIKIGKRYHMFFCYRYMQGFRSQAGRGYKTGYAYSDNLKDWTRDDVQGGLQLSSEGWDSEMMCYPNIFACQDEIFLLYNGNTFGKTGFGLAKLVRG